MIKISEEQANGLIAEELIKIGYEERVEEAYDELEKEAGKISGATRSVMDWTGKATRNTGRFMKRNQPFQGAYYKRMGSNAADAITGMTAKGRKAVKAKKAVLKASRKKALAGTENLTARDAIKEKYRTGVRAVKDSQSRLNLGKRVTHGLKATGKASGVGVAGYGGYRGWKAVDERNR